ncbi:MAG: hypothetical protein R3346_04880 [Candidatus Spechtbacterales bacterium]|nr:hypothetical protein [Candidatus Spechtbacterales bacterium]
MKAVRHVIAGICIIATFASIVLFSVGVVFTRPPVTVPVRNNIENAITIQDFDYNFESWRAGILSGAGAGGQGAAIIWTQSPNQFISELEPGENIYQVFQEVGGSSNAVVAKIYIAGIENRNLLLGYKDIYEPPPGGYVVDSISNTEIVYKQNSYDARNVLFLIAAPVFFLIAFFVIPPREYQ